MLNHCNTACIVYLYNFFYLSLFKFYFHNTRFMSSSTHIYRLFGRRPPMVSCPPPPYTHHSKEVFFTIFTTQFVLFFTVFLVTQEIRFLFWTRRVGCSQLLWGDEGLGISLCLMCFFLLFRAAVDLWAKKSRFRINRPLKRNGLTKCCNSFLCYHPIFIINPSRVKPLHQRFVYFLPKYNGCGHGEVECKLLFTQTGPMGKNPPWTPVPLIDSVRNVSGRTLYFSTAEISANHSRPRSGSIDIFFGPPLGCWFARYCDFLESFACQKVLGFFSIEFKYFLSIDTNQVPISAFFQRQLFGLISMSRQFQLF